MKPLTSPRPAIFWTGFLLNILPLNLCLLGILTIDQASYWMDIGWIPTCLMMLISFDFPLIALLLIIKAMMLGAGHKFYPFYMAINMPPVQVVALLIFTMIIAEISYIQRHASKQCS